MSKAELQCATCDHWKPGNVTQDTDPPTTFGECAMLAYWAGRQQRTGVSVPNYFGCTLHTIGARIIRKQEPTHAPD